MNVALVGQRIDRVRKLTGFRTSHRVPDQVNQFTEAFIARIANDDISADSENMFDAIRTHFRFKRNEIGVSECSTDGTATIATPYFDYTVTVSLDSTNPAQVVWHRQLTEIREIDQVLTEASTQVFGGMFNTVELSPPQPFDLNALIDRIEGLASERITVDYDKAATWCKVSIAGLTGEVKVTSGTLSLKQPNPKTPGILLQSFLDFQAALIETYGVGMTAVGSLPKPNIE